MKDAGASSAVAGNAKGFTIARDAVSPASRIAVSEVAGRFALCHFPIAEGVGQGQLVTGVGGPCIGVWCFGCGYQLSTASITKNPIT
jgi:hypothetical protein